MKTMMTRILAGVTVLAAAAAMLMVPLQVQATKPGSTAAPVDGHKYVICHVPPGNINNIIEITVDAAAWEEFENGVSPHNSHCAKENPLVCDFEYDEQYGCSVVPEGS